MQRILELVKGCQQVFFCRIGAYLYDDSKVVISIGNNFKVNDYVHIARTKELQSEIMCS